MGAKGLAAGGGAAAKRFPSFKSEASAIEPRLEEHAEHVVTAGPAIPSPSHASRSVDPARKFPSDLNSNYGGATLLAVPIRKERAFLRESVDVRRLVAHHALVVGADVPITDVIAPEDKDVGFLPGANRRR